MEDQLKRISVNHLERFVAKINNTNILIDEFALYWKSFFDYGIRLS